MFICFFYDIMNKYIYIFIYVKSDNNRSRLIIELEGEF